MTEHTVAITGLALRLPGATNQDEFWRVLVDGVDRTAPVSRARRILARAPHWDDVIGEIPGIELFDAGFFGIEDHEARFMDPQHRLTMELAHEAMADAGLLEPDRPSARRYAVHTAIATNAYYPLVCRYIDDHGADDIHPRTVMNVINSAAAARVSHQYNLTGPVTSVDTACSSFLTALVQGADDVLSGGCDGAVIAGVNLLSTHHNAVLCNAGGITTAHPFTRVFDEEADGTLLGEGAVVVVLERDDLALARNRRIYGRLRGYAINNDGSSLSIMAPNPRGQAEVVRDAYANGVDHTRVRYVEMHGTGTRIGDPIEVNALSKVYRSEDFTDAGIGIGSVKSNIGHLLSAAGGAGLAKLLLSMKHAMMAPNLHLTTVNPLLQLESTPFRVVTEPTQWPCTAGVPRMGALTSLGLGGTNVHVVVEEGDPDVVGTSLPAPLLCISARTDEALRTLVADASAQLAAGADAYNLAMTLARYRPSYERRAVLRFDPRTGDVLSTRTACAERAPKRALVRPGIASRTWAEAVVGVPIEVSDAERKRTDVVIAFDGAADAHTIVIDPDATAVEAAAALFIAGVPVAWDAVFPDSTGTVLTLPPYPYSREPHWL